MSSKDRAGFKDLGNLKEQMRRKYQSSQQDIPDEELPGYHPSVIRQWERDAVLATAGETAIESLFEEGTAPESNPGNTETNHQKRTTVTSDTPAIPLLPPLPIPPAMQRSPLQLPQPAPINFGDGTQRRTDRSMGGKDTRREAESVPQVTMNEEQQELLGWVVLLERCEALHYARKERKLVLFNQCATFVISVLGIIGGCIAIRSGVGSITERERDRRN